MLTVTLNEEQYKYLFILLDTDLKINGLNSLMRVIDLNNALLSAKNNEENKERK